MPSTYLSPGVYVEEVASGNAPIAGVGTSTAAFIGLFSPISTTVTTRTETISLDAPVPVSTETEPLNTFVLPSPTLELGETFTVLAEEGSYEFLLEGADTPLAVQEPTVEAGQIIVRAQETLASGSTLQGSFQVLITTPPEVTEESPPTAAGDVKLCTNFSEFKQYFGDFSTDPGQSRLAHAVYGFFRNGGTRCYVIQIETELEIDAALEQFEAIDEIAIVAAPGVTERALLDKLIGHCQQLADRVAIVDPPEEAVLSNPNLVQTLKPFNSDYAALYFPWIQVFDPATKAQNPDGDGLIYVPPSGHMAGIYARVDTQRGVHKAPANEAVVGAVGLRYPISRSRQDGLNPDGINCIRDLNGNIRVWGARTMGGDANGEFKYINIRRLFNFLRESIDEGTQWTVFEPNDLALWAAIRRNVTAFLTLVWRSGALFGNTPSDAFYVKCDEETNPPAVRDQGQVITEIGVAVVKPAEFVVFRISQWSGPDAG